MRSPRSGRQVSRKLAFRARSFGLLKLCLCAPGFLAKFVAMLCSAPAQLEPPASPNVRKKPSSNFPRARCRLLMCLGSSSQEKDKESIGLKTLRDVVLAILTAEKRESLASSKLPALELCRLLGSLLR
jgi:hypothetical protein